MQLLKVFCSCVLVQQNAKQRCPKDTGALRRSIYVAVQASEEKVTGIVYTNEEYATYVEFGTGPVGEANHAGISPNVTPVYSQTGWFTKKEYADTGSKIGHMRGQAAQPFMYPALKDNEERVTRNISNYIAREIKKVCE